MKAAVLHEVNKPLVIEDVSLQKPGPREVLIRMGLRGASPAPAPRERTRPRVSLT